MNYPKFVLFTGQDDQFYFRLHALNAEPILRSEGYVNKSGCQNGIASVKENASDDERYQRKTSTDEQFYFNLTAANGEVIGTSEMYISKVARDNGIRSVKNTAPRAPPEDTTGDGD